MQCLHSQKKCKLLQSTEAAVGLLCGPQVVLECAAFLLKADQNVPLSIQYSAFKCGKCNLSFELLFNSIQISFNHSLLTGLNGNVQYVQYVSILYICTILFLFFLKIDMVTINQNVILVC